GYPISIEILEGNINDKSTLQSKVNELKERFKIKEIIFVFDRGMKTNINLECNID
ncbi:hypothetical protein VAMP_125n114, partial [Candidatus Vampirococcus lugosii]|nr:hypothetical protein [Candidatus Vampirococcus lugosii]